MDHLNIIRARINERNRLSSVFDEIIDSYGKILEGVYFYGGSNDTSYEREKDRKQVIELQEEVISLHKKLNHTSNGQQLLTDENSALRKDVECLIARQQEWILEKATLLKTLEEKELLISEKERVIQMQADEYTSLRLDANLSRENYGSLKRDYDILLDRYTKEQIERAEKQNLELEQNERRLKEYSMSPGLRIKDIMSEDPITFGSSIVSAVSGFFNPQKRYASIAHSNEPMKQSQFVLPTTCPTNLKIEWTSSNADNIACKFHPNGSIVAITGADRKINIWSLDNTTSENTLPTLQFQYIGSNKAISSLEFNAQVSEKNDKESIKPNTKFVEGTILFGGSTDFALRLWSYGPVKRLMQTHNGHTGRISAVCSCSSAMVASASHDRTIRLWDINEHQCCRTFCVGSSCLDMKKMFSSTDCSVLLSSHHDKSIRLHDNRQSSDSAAVQCVLSERAPAIAYVSYGSSSNEIICCQRDNLISTIDIRKMDTIKQINHELFKMHSDCQKCDLSADAVYLAIGSTNGYTMIFDVKNKGCIEQLLESGREFPIICTCWQPIQQEAGLVVSSGNLLALEKQKIALLYQ